MNALILDDETMLCEIIGSVLDKKSVVYDSYQDPIEALESIADRDYDFIFVDIGLPNMNGLEFSKRFKQRQPWSDIVFITGSGDYDKAVEAIKIGVYDFVRKPFQLIELSMCVGRLVEKRKLYEAKKRKQILDFANTMSLKLMHELRNPLTAIGGFSRRASDADCCLEKLKEYAGIIFDQSVRLEKAFSEVLTHLKAGEGEQDLQEPAHPR
jgi:DNA-binding NtrC family response regulator